MKKTAFLLYVFCLTVFSSGAFAQAVLTGRVSVPKDPGSDAREWMTAVYAFATPAGEGRQSTSHRTWEMEPAGWYWLNGQSGRYNMAFVGPSHYMRPIVMTNLYTRDGEVLDQPLTPSFWYSVFNDSQWDDKPASDYFQPFVAKGTSVTHVGYRFAHDGIDGVGPGSQNIIVRILKKGAGTPDKWPQVGPAILIPNVDSGGPKQYIFSAGWNSGDVPTVPGETYVAHMRVEVKGNGIQAYVQATDDPAEKVYRLGEGPTGFQNYKIWMTVSGDGDGIVIPYNKRVHQQFVDLTNFSKKWSQTYVAKGRSLASVSVYAAFSGIQPGIDRQRVAIRVREGGPNGPLVGIEKVAIGNGNHTGDASWGLFGAVFAPGEVPLTPGKTYALEFESLENFETLHGYVNIKNMVSDDRPGFTPYKKVPPDDYPQGTAYFNGTERRDYDLDMQVLEYQYDVPGWDMAVQPRNLIINPRMDIGQTARPEEGLGISTNRGIVVASMTDQGRPVGWNPFVITEGTVLQYMVDPNEPRNRILRVVGGETTGQHADGGYVQRVSGLSKFETYILEGQARSTFQANKDSQVYIGYDPTGQTEDPEATTIVWQVMPRMHGIWENYRSEPIRPVEDAVSVWVRGRTTTVSNYPFKGDFDNFSLRQIRTDAPNPASVRLTSQ